MRSAHGLSATAEVLALPWHEIVRNYTVRLVEVADIDRAVDEALAAYERTPRGRLAAQRRHVEILNASVAVALAGLP